MIHASKLIPSVQQVGLIKTKLKAVYWEMEAPTLLVDSKVYEFDHDLRKAIWFTSSGPICISLHFIAMLGFVQDLLHLRKAFASQDQRNWLYLCQTVHLFAHVPNVSSVEPRKLSRKYCYVYTTTMEI